MLRGVVFQFFEWNRDPDGTLWSEAAEQAASLKQRGVSALWLPPPFKALHGAADAGFAVYDLYDLGEFDQKGSVRTRYGTKGEFIAAVRAAQDAGLHIYVDVVFNHRMGADETEEVEVVEVDWHDRHQAVSEPYTIHAWSRFTFPGRGETYSPLKLGWRHFTAFGVDAGAPKTDERKIFRIAGKTFTGETSLEFGAHDYLMGASVDLHHPEVRDDLFRWGRWFLDLTGANGFRMDAVRHMPLSFTRDWLEQVREHARDREVFAVGEYWSDNLEELRQFIDNTDRAIHLFDVPLHVRLSEASKQGSRFDLRTIFSDTLVNIEPDRAVTFVDNHDSQPGQPIESWVDDWFKPHAYALILLREHGYPCVFYGDYYGNDSEMHRLTSHRQLIDAFLRARQQHTWGNRQDHFDDSNCIGWVWTGDEGHSPMVVLMSNDDRNTSKRLCVCGGPHTFRDITGHVDRPITTDADDSAEFICPPRGVSVWCAQ